MKYINAKLLLPDALVKELQCYIQGGYIYVPASEERHRCWGELTGYKEELKQRNKKIVEAYNNGSSIKYLAEKHYLSVYTIRKIIYQK
ncbi:CD3324 family protein [Sinanaerobacter sp. ZZT-01]|uniref:CD3324 family protein n=1 Tax=Sinanaerobacter sp. ZZT-01 TaxID=3111540 RepID=UPI002D770CC6|nr:CD3324 family protein [Sinanaerobacter sp. ZZT-01]WRR94478.1 CD3324 family protein [Sinanaerobacter sp. ZZT-01]